LTSPAGDIDRSLMVRHHQGNKIAVDVAGWIDGHAQAHFAYSQVIVDYKLRFVL
jgi:hypothetical protein